MRHLFWCLLICILGPTAITQAQTQGELFVFVQPKRSISKDFIRNDLSQLESMAKGQNMDITVIDATKGVPSEVTVTPSIFIVKNGKYTLYEGRYSDMVAIQNFMKSGKSKKVTQPERENVMTWQSGRSTLVAQCEMHPIDGGGNSIDQAEAWEALKGGMLYFKKASTSSIPASARQFYLDFYPEKTSDGLMLVQVKLHSGFDMDTPVFESEVPCGSEIKEWEKAFEKAGKRLEVMLLAQVGSNENGDGFEFVKNNIPMKEWDSLTAYDPSQVNTSMIARLSK